MLESFSIKMKKSGYDEEERKRILRRGLVGYERILKLAKDGTRKVHRAGSSTIGSRYMKKLTGKKNWYKTRKHDTRDERLENWSSPTKRKDNSVRSKPNKSQNKQQKEQEPKSILFVN